MEICNQISCTHGLMRKNHSVFSGNKNGSQQTSRMFKDVSITDYSGNQYHTKTWMLT